MMPGIPWLTVQNKPSFFMKEQLDPLSEADAPVVAAHYTGLVEKYRIELDTQRQQAQQFIQVQAAQKAKSGLVCKGQIGAVEAAMLYIMIREHKPAETIEIGALCGSSTRWILAALERNGHGHLTTYDLHDYTPSFVNRSFAPSVLKHRWSFVQGDAIAALDKDDVPFDAELLFIDALHRNSFAQLYTDRLLRKAAAAISHPLPVFVHDIFSPFMIPAFKHCQTDMSLATLRTEVDCIRRAAKATSGNRLDLLYSEKQPGGEGIELMAWLARTARSKAFVTFSMYAAPAV